MNFMTILCQCLRITSRVHGLKKPLIGGTSKFYSAFAALTSTRTFSQIPGLRAKSGKKTVTRQQPRNSGFTPAQRIANQLVRKLEAADTAGAFRLNGQDHEDKDERNRALSSGDKPNDNREGKQMDRRSFDDGHEDDSELEGMYANSTEPESDKEESHWHDRDEDEGQSHNTSSTEPDSENEEKHKEWEVRQMARVRRFQRSEVAQQTNDGLHRNGGGRKEGESHRDVRHGMEVARREEEVRKEAEQQEKEVRRKEFEGLDAARRQWERRMEEGRRKDESHRREVVRRKEEGRREAERQQEEFFQKEIERRKEARRQWERQMEETRRQEEDARKEAERQQEEDRRKEIERRKEEVELEHRVEESHRQEESLRKEVEHRNSEVKGSNLKGQIRRKLTISIPPLTTRGSKARKRVRLFSFYFHSNFKLI